jgi:hypothetical protein
MGGRGTMWRGYVTSPLGGNARSEACFHSRLYLGGNVPPVVPRRHLGPPGDRPPRAGVRRAGMLYGKDRLPLTCFRENRL